MEMITGWAPVVQSRTLHADFSDFLLAVPGDIWETRAEGPDSLYVWLRSIVNRAILDANKLDRRKLTKAFGGMSSQPQSVDYSRWILAKSSSACLFGVACMAYDIHPIADLASQQNGYKGEDIPIFLGYASVIDPEKYPAPHHHPGFPTLDELRQPDYALMRPLFKFVADKWNDVRHKASDPPTLTNATMMPPAFPGRIQNSNQFSVDLNPDAKEIEHVRAWAWNEGSKIWEVAASATGFPLTLCVGVADAHDAERLRYSNVVFRVGGEGDQAVPSEGRMIVVKSKVAPVEEDSPAIEGSQAARGVIDYGYSVNANDLYDRSSYSHGYKTDSQGPNASMFAAGIGAVAGFGSKVIGASWGIAAAVGVGTFAAVKWAANGITPSSDHVGRRQEPQMNRRASNLNNDELAEDTGTALTRAAEAHKEQDLGNTDEPPIDDTSIKKVPKW